jgi:LacI family transcriptional regulator
MPRVAVLVDTSTSWGRRVHTGIHKYDCKHGPWQLFVEARGMEERLRVPARWQGDGVIARIGNLAMARELEALRLPVINVSGIELPGVKFPRVITDLEASAKLAARHFLDRGFRHFAYFSLIGLAYVAVQQEAFARAVTRAGGDFSSFAVKPMAGAEPDWNLDLAKLGDWLKSLPKPVAILTWNASGAREVIYACHAAGLLVPEDVAVLSGSDDELLCDLLSIPISGILVSAERSGFLAAEMLDQWMRGRAPRKKSLLLPPLTVVHRQSTDTLAIRDRALVRALSFIRANAATPIQVEDVARNAGVSRRVLERRFAQVLGRTPATEIRRAHLERAKHLLVETDLPVPDVAEAAGFASPEYLAYAFKAETGKSPISYRVEARSK